MLFQRAWLVKNFRVLDSNRILSSLCSKDFHPDKEVFLEEEPRYPIPLPKEGEGKVREGTSSSGSSNELRFISETNNRLHLLVKATEEYVIGVKRHLFPGVEGLCGWREDEDLQG